MTHCNIEFNAETSAFNHNSEISLDEADESDPLTSRKQQPSRALTHLDPSSSPPSRRPPIADSK